MRIRETRTENTKKDNKSGGKHHGKESLHCGTVQSNTVHGRCDVVLCNTHAPPTDILAYILLFVFNLVISGAASSLSYGLQSTSSLLKQNNQKALILV